MPGIDCEEVSRKLYNIFMQVVICTGFGELPGVYVGVLKVVGLNLIIPLFSSSA